MMRILPPCWSGWSLKKKKNERNVARHTDASFVGAESIENGPQAGDMNMNVSVHKDISGALVLAETLPPQFTLRSKYYATKTIWFCEEIHKRGIKLKKIETSEKLGDTMAVAVTVAAWW
jgi:hypothetical protein